MVGCVLEIKQSCDHCGECNLCDLDRTVECRNCMKCVISEEKSRYLTIDEIKPDLKEKDGKGD